MITKYPDGTSYADINNENYAYINKRINSYEDLWHLGQILEAANHNGVKPTVFIPNLPDAQADRRFSKTQSSGLKIVCNFLNQFDVLEYQIFHPHNPEVVEALLNNCKIVSPALALTKALGHVPTQELILMSADAGGFKPLMKLCDEINWKGETMSGSKARFWDGTKSILTQSIPDKDLTGKDVMIVDDLCMYGGTFKGLEQRLADKNVNMVYLYVSHLTIQNHFGSKTIFNTFDDVFTTNSKYETYSVENRHGEPQAPPNLKLIEII